MGYREDLIRDTYSKAIKEFIVQELQQRTHEEPGESVLLPRSRSERDQVPGLFVEILGGSIIIRAFDTIIVQETSSAVFTIPEPLVQSIQIPHVGDVDLL